MMAAATVAVRSQSQGGMENGKVVRLPKMLSVRTVGRALGRERRWVFRMCQASKKHGSPWPGTTMMGNAWRIPEQAVVTWWASQAGISIDQATALLTTAERR
jgi:hypothetical protein